jgi:hypothetical protein
MSAVPQAPLRLSLRAGFLEKREKGRTLSYFTSTIQETRVNRAHPPKVVENGEVIPYGAIRALTWVSLSVAPLPLLP